MDGTPRPEVVAGDRLIRSLVRLATELGLDRRDFVIFGSAPLLAHGLRREVHDLDVVARGVAWERVMQHGELRIGTINGARMAVFCDGLIEFSRGWVSEDWDVDHLIDRAQVIAGLPFARLDDVLAYKRALNRPKDAADIRAIVELMRDQDDELATST
jgi:hypothetical protein